MRVSTQVRGWGELSGLNHSLRPVYDQRVRKPQSDLLVSSAEGVGVSAVFARKVHPLINVFLLGLLSLLTHCTPDFERNAEFVELKHRAELLELDDLYNNIRTHEQGWLEACKNTIENDSTYICGDDPALKNLMKATLAAIFRNNLFDDTNRALKSGMRASKISVDYWIEAKQKFEEGRTIEGKTLQLYAKILYNPQTKQEYALNSLIRFENEPDEEMYHIVSDEFIRDELLPYQYLRQTEALLDKAGTIPLYKLRNILMNKEYDNQPLTQEQVKQLARIYDQREKEEQDPC